MPGLSRVRTDPDRGRAFLAQSLAAAAHCNAATRASWSRSQIQSPTRARVELYNRHKELRGLASDRDGIDLEGYREFLVVSCCETFELRYLLDGQLIGVALVDRSDEALSAVYCYYDPSYEKLGIGTFSVLKQIELCKTWGLRYLYLGLYIAESERMRYKALFLPHQRRIDGSWRTFDREA